MKPSTSNKGRPEPTSVCFLYRHEFNLLVAEGHWLLPHSRCSRLAQIESASGIAAQADVIDGMLPPLEHTQDGYLLTISAPAGTAVPEAEGFPQAALCQLFSALDSLYGRTFELHLEDVVEVLPLSEQAREFLLPRVDRWLVLGEARYEAVVDVCLERRLEERVSAGIDQMLEICSVHSSRLEQHRHDIANAVLARLASTDLAEGAPFVQCLACYDRHDTYAEGDLKYLFCYNEIRTSAAGLSRKRTRKSAFYKYLSDNSRALANAPLPALLRGVLSAEKCERLLKSAMALGPFAHPVTAVTFLKFRASFKSTFDNRKMLAQDSVLDDLRELHEEFGDEVSLAIGLLGALFHGKLQGDLYAVRSAPICRVPQPTPVKSQAPEVAGMPAKLEEEASAKQADAAAAESETPPTPGPLGKKAQPARPNTAHGGSSGAENAADHADTKDMPLPPPHAGDLCEESEAEPEPEAQISPAPVEPDVQDEAPSEDGRSKNEASAADPEELATAPRPAQLFLALPDGSEPASIAEPDTPGEPQTPPAEALAAVDGPTMGNEPAVAPRNEAPEPAEQRSKPSGPHRGHPDEVLPSTELSSPEPE
jgi:hypothetical protein